LYKWATALRNTSVSKCFSIPLALPDNVVGLEHSKSSAEKLMLRNKIPTNNSVNKGSVGFTSFESYPALKLKVKLSLCFNRAPRHEGVLGEWRYSSTHSLTSALDGGEWSASRPGRFTPRERAPVIHWIGGWVGRRAVLDAVVKREIPSPRRESNPRTPIVQPAARHILRNYFYVTEASSLALLKNVH
jgi:hypothetical protein